MGTLRTFYSLLIAVVAPFAGGAELLLAENGVARVPIVTSAKATPETRAVAAELAGYLQRITGATFDVKDATGDSGIVLGTIGEFPDDSLSKALEIRGRFDGREAYAIRTDGQRVRLIGATELGASHAAFALLERVGCRWFFPAPQWEVVPSIPTLRVSVEETDRPVIWSRRIWYGWGNFSEKGNVRNPQRDYDAWARHNRMAQSLPVNAGHAWQNIIVDNRKLFEEHPEYRALTGGKRQGEQLCVSNPAVRQLAVEHVLKQFERRPGLEMASIECSDGGGHCECDECRKLGSFSNQVFDLANHVARAVAARYPGKLVGLYAYHEHSEPPTFDLEPNVYVQLTAGFTTGRYTFDELMDEWPKRCRNMGFYEYFSVWSWDADRLPGGRGGDVAYMQRQIGRYAQRHATSLDAESGNNWGPHGRGYYVANRLMWNPKTDVDGLLADFYEKAFGPAAAVIKRYYERLDPGNKPLMSRSLLGLAFGDLKEASELAKGRADVQARLDQLKQYLRYEQLCWMRDRESDPQKKKALALEVIRHSYRTRYTYMTHWRAMEQQGTPKYAKEFKEPSWDVHERQTKVKPWMDERPITHEETERAFEEGLTYFVPQEVAERTFSMDLVPAKLEGPAVASAQAYQGGARYAVYSREGEDVALDVTAGTIAWYRNRAEARYWLRASDETVVAEGRLPLDGLVHRLTMKVPKGGLYWFDFNDSSAGWKIAAEAGRAVSVLLRKEKGFAHAGHMQRMYFYVPKGTKKVEYYWMGGPHKVLGPDGKVVMDVKSNGEFVSIPVGEGMDGKAWSFTQLALGHLWFFNVPNVLAASPGALVLPREVVEGEGL
jgi:hypothetical protein